ncbi:hypothetical protein [Nocardia sp. NBC_00511]|uniref:phage terminase small subunit n=1 Tax=Nocardia sp. NBC_00511 TaxID=2903591 RepID=UPI0030E1873E
MPVPPKRSDQRRRRNKPKFEAEHGLDTPVGAVDAPPLDIEGLHEIAVAWYDALKVSPEGRYFTAAIWQRARVTALLLSRHLSAERTSAQMHLALQADMRDLLVSAADQRRLGIEVQRPQADLDEDAAVVQLNEYVTRFSG